MIYTPKIQQAIEFAIQVHEIDQKQKRKGTDVAYITHPLTVGLLLSLSGASEDVVIAGILHDTIEDSVENHKVTKEQITELFGKTICDLILSVTEQDKSLSWEARKTEAIEHIKTFSYDSLLLKSADLLSNTREIIATFQKDGDTMFMNFNTSKNKLLQMYILTMKAVIDRWSDNPLATDLIAVTKDLNKINSE